MINFDFKNIEFDLNDFKTPLPKIRKRSSIFEVPADEEIFMETEQRFTKKYENQLQIEYANWEKLVRHKIQMNKELYNQKLTVDEKILSADQLEFVKSRVNLQKFVDDYQAFSKKATTYVLYKEDVLRRRKFANTLIENAIDEKSNALLSNAISSKP